MTYELVRKLKTAGFPNLCSVCKDFFDKPIDMICSECEDLYVPTLEELLREIPMREKHLGTLNDAHFILRKLVTSNPNGKYLAGMEDEDSGDLIIGYYFSGEDAAVQVAKLYIAIQEAEAHYHLRST